MIKNRDQIKVRDIMSMAARMSQYFHRIYDMYERQKTAETAVARIRIERDIANPNMKS